MRYILLVLLGLSLPVLAAEEGQHQGTSAFIDRIVDVVPPCDPHKALDIPPFN